MKKSNIDIVIVLLIISILCFGTYLVVEIKTSFDNFDINFVESKIELKTTKEIIKEPKQKSLGIFIVTAYCPCEHCSGQWGDSLAYPCDAVHKAVQGHTIGADKNVLSMGSTITLFGSKYIVEDVGGAIKGNRLDLYFDRHEDAVEFGVQEVEVFTDE